MFTPKNFLNDSQKRLCDKLHISYDLFEKKLLEECLLEARFGDIKAGDVVGGLTYRPTNDGVIRWVVEE